jgi:curved DNA-binding protein CbpA
MEPDQDPYRVLQVDPRAHESVIRAAYRALARLYHPDGVQPHSDRMSQLNRAYDLLRDPARRRAYDAGHLARPSERQASQDLRPMGPGMAGGWSRPWGRDPAGDRPTTVESAAQQQPPPPPAGGAFSRARMATSSPRLDFGRYQGWSLADVAKVDVDYLRWLRRHSSGLRFRREIDRLVPPERDDEPAAVRARRL